LIEELLAIRKILLEAAAVLNLRVSGGGAHPFHDWADRRIYPNERFQFVVERYGYLAKQFTVFGQHIHVGCASGDDAVFLVHMLTRYVPHFIALSAASPYYQSEDTTFQSSRLTAVSAFPLAGHMPFVADWAEFLQFFARMKTFGVVGSMKDFYWDIRPKPEYGTVEIRVCDTPLTVRRAGLLAAYAQALAAYHLAERPHRPVRDIYLVNAFNRFEACRYGFDGHMIEPFSGRRKKIGDDILDELARLAPHAARAGSAELLMELGGVVRNGVSDADWLRERHREHGGEREALANVVRDACKRWSE
ncbi:MAG TPA: YbdK family carboxylate-amine ligase, partial [Burkholderiales bacterium]|nr:YbdK family carboxylate-amine ligase [Burkholderiales bacterium]